MSDLWSGYYKRGDVHSSTMQFSAEARERISSRWRSLFAELPSDSSVLDIGTGAGALLSLAADTTGADHRLSLTGVDLATTRPETAPRSTATCSIELRGGVEFGALPFDDASFTLVVSQFAVEYGDFPRTLREAARVSGRRFVALVHARDGVVIRQNAPIAEQIDWLLGDLRLVEILMHHVQRPTAATRQQLKLAAAEMSRRIATLENPSFLQGLARNVGEFLMAHEQNPEIENVRLLTELERQLRNQADRMKALAVAARTPEEMDKACSIFIDAGFATVRWTAQRSDHDRHLVGYWLTAGGRRS